MSRESRVMTRHIWIIWVLETCLISAEMRNLATLGHVSPSFALAALTGSLYFITSD